MKLLVDPNERQGYAWIRMRIKRIWHKWDAAVTSLSKKQDMSRRKQKKVKICMSCCSSAQATLFLQIDDIHCDRKPLPPLSIISTMVMGGRRGKATKGFKRILCIVMRERTPGKPG